MAALKAGSRPPWLGLAAAVWVEIASGNAATFPLYSSALKSVMGFSQQQLTILGVANDIGENIGLIPGIACNHFPPWVILLIGTITCFVGYGILWLAVSQTVSLPYWVLWIALCVGPNSAAWLGTGVIVTNMMNFPLSRGTVAGILKGYVGLSAAVFTEVYSGLLGNSASNLLLFLTLGIPMLCLVMMYFIRHCTPIVDEDSAQRGYFLFAQVCSVFLGIYLLTTTIVENSVSLSTTVSYVLFCIMILLLLAPVAIPLKMTICPSNRKKTGIFDQASSSECLIAGELNADKTNLLLNATSSAQNLGSFQEGDDVSDVSLLLAEGEGAVKKKRRPRRGEDFEFFEAVIKADFWLLFLVYFIGVGSGVTVLNNLAQIGVSEGVRDTTVLLSLFSFCNFLGRLGGGVVSEYFVRSSTTPRTIFMTLTQIVMIVAYLLFASFLNGTLYVATALLGICYGAQFSVMVPTASELFGLKSFGIIYNFMSLGNPLGALLFSGGLAGYIYDQEAKKQSDGLKHGSSTCIGPNCFRLTFLVLAGVCVLGSILSVILTVRIRPVYRMLYAGGSFRHRQDSLH